MKRLVELANKIEDKELRKKVIEFIKDPRLSNKHFKKYPAMSIEDARTYFSVGSTSGMVTVERDVLKHSIALVDLCLRVADSIEKNYGIPLNRDYLIAAGIVHDIMKVYEYKKGERGKLEHTGILLDHSMLGVAELYHREFPEEVIHIVASHFGEAGPTPPRTFEALIFHHCDTILSLVEFHLQEPKKESMQLVLFDEEALRKIIEKEIEKK